MIVDKIENSSLYLTLHHRFEKAFEFLRKTDFSLLEPSKYELDGEDLFAIVNKHKTQDFPEPKLEAHKKYIDIHYMHSGTENIAISTLIDQSPIQEYDPIDDFHLFLDETYNIQLKNRMFAILFPDDLHLPGIRFKKTQKVIKVVIKVKI